jgi:hypothetical protein
MRSPAILFLTFYNICHRTNVLYIYNGTARRKCPASTYINFSTSGNHAPIKESAVLQIVKLGSSRLLPGGLGFGLLYGANRHIPKSPVIEAGHDHQILS